MSNKAVPTRTTGHYEGFDASEFWEGSENFRDHSEPVPSDEQIAEIEAELGYRLPDSMIEFIHLPGSRNGGNPERCGYRLTGDDADELDVAIITSLFAVGRTSDLSLLGENGGPFRMAEWGYPEIGVYFADTPSAGHEMITLDYRECGPQGEPSVVHVAQESDYAITQVAPDFATFIRGLITDDECFADEYAEEFQEELESVRHGTLSPILERALEAAGEELPDGETILRTIAERIVQEKESFTLPGDADSELMYDATFWLYSKIATAASFDDYFKMAEGQSDYERPCHVLMLCISFVDDRYGFNTGGYSPAHAHKWWRARVKSKQIVQSKGGWRFTPDFEAEVFSRLKAER